MATGQIGEAHVSLRATMEQYERDLNRARASTERAANQMTGSMRRVEVATSRVSTEMHRTQLGIQRLSRQFLVLRAAIAAIPAVLGVRAISQMADAWVLLGARLGLVTDSAEQAAATQEKLFQVAQRSRTPLADVATTFVRLRLATDELGLSEEAALRVTESFTKALITGGATTQEASSALLQFSQALGRGVAKGDELRALYENFPGLFRIIGAESGKTGRQVVQDALENGLAVDKMINAMITGAKEIDKDFATIPITIGQSITQLSNSLQKAVGITSTAGEAYDSLVDTLNELRDTIDDPAFQRGLIAIFQVIAFIVKDVARGIARIGATVDIISKLAQGDIGGIWEKYLTATKQAAEGTAAVTEGVEGIAGAGNEADGISDIMEDIARAIQDLKTEAALAGLEAFKFAGALDQLKVVFKGQDVGLIRPEALIAALKELADTGFDVTRNFLDWPAAVQQAFQALVLAEEGARRVTDQVETQTENVKELTDAYKEYQQTRVQGLDAAIAKGEEEHEKWLEQQQERKQIEEERAGRIESSSRLPDDIEVANIAAAELAATLTDVSNLSFDSLRDSFVEISQQIAEMVLQALIFRAIMGAGGAVGGAFGAGAGGGAPLFSAAQMGTARHGMILKGMAGGGFITNRPTIIPMATGAAMVSEYGQEEAVMPLKRMASGDLGVAFEGGPGGGPIINIDARQSTPGTAAAAVAQAVRLAPGAIVNAQARGQMGRGKAPF